MDYDLIAKKIENYFRKLKIDFRHTSLYIEEKHELVESTMSCDEAEAIMFFASTMKCLVHLGTDVNNRIRVYSEFMAAYDLYKSLTKNF